MSVGFSVAYFQVPWATKSGGLVVMGVEASCVPLVFESLILPPMHVMQGHHWSVLDRCTVGTTEGVLLPSM
jgi:hypothetical protein